MDFIKAAAVSPRIALGDPRKNAEAAAHAVLDCARERVQLLVFPELFLSGASCGDLFLQQPLLDACETALGTLLQQTAQTDLLFAVGLPLRAAGRLYNCAALCRGGVLLGFVPRLGQAGDCFADGADCALSELEFRGKQYPFGRLLLALSPEILLGIAVGENMARPYAAEAPLAAAGATVILRLCAQKAVMEPQIRKTLTLRSADCCCAVVAAFAGMGESSTDAVFGGDCLLAQEGALLAASDDFGNPAAATAWIDPQRLVSLRRSTGFYDGNPQPELPQIAVSLPSAQEADFAQHVPPLPFVPQEAGLARARAIQSAGLARRMRHTGLNALVLGLSGGLDSTLAALVARDALAQLGLPAENLRLIAMPGFGTGVRTKGNAVRLADALGIPLQEISIEPACVQHMRDIGLDMNARDATYENLQARERTQILMDLANKENALVVGTGDMSELALGWCTYNGDHMSMYAVNAGVPKTLVRALIAHEAKNAPEALRAVLRDILDTPVSPELLPPTAQGDITQKTEETLGAYEAHDFFLYYFLRYGMPPQKILLLAKQAFGEKYPEETLRAWLQAFLRRFFSQQFKRSCLPDGPAVTDLSLSPRAGGFAMPSDAPANAWQLEEDDA